MGRRVGSGQAGAEASKIRWLRQDALRIAEDPLYPALYRMEQIGWINACCGKNENNRRARVYTPTPAGNAKPAGEVAGWEAFTTAVATAMDTAEISRVERCLP